MVFFIGSIHLSTLMAHRLRIDAVHSSTSKEIQMSQSTQPSCQEPAKTAMGQQSLNIFRISSNIYQ